VDVAKLSINFFGRAGLLPAKPLTYKCRFISVVAQGE
jgi:hypothetical protein